MVDSQQIAERLIILNNRCVGILTRLYNIKKSCENVSARPKVLTEKQYEQAVSVITKKFPIMDLKKNSNAFSNIDDSKNEVLKSLHPYYYTFVHLLELKEHVLQQLTLMDATQFYFDITLNFDATTAYLNMIINFISAMILLSRIEERKSIIGLYNVAHEFSKGSSEGKFPRLAQLVVDYEVPWKKLSDDLGPLHRSISVALTSLVELYKRRNIPADEQRNSHLISLSANPQQLVFAAQTPTCACEYLSLDLIDRWVIFCVTACHGTLLMNDVLADLFYRCLRNGVCIRLFRDENVQVFTMLQSYFETIKGYDRRCKELKEIYNNTLHTCVSLHAHKRQFLRNALRDLCFLIKDQPGLLGPKVLLVWMGLSYARDEVGWILRHNQVWPAIMASNKKSKDLSDVGINDKALAELLFYMFDLQNLIQKYSDVITRYHLRYIQSYDVIDLAQMLPELHGLTERDALLVRSAIDQLRSGSNQENWDLRGIRLDWFRFQTLVSTCNSTFKITTNREFVQSMNTLVYHSKMVDLIPDMIKETSDLSIYCFYFQQFDFQLKQTLSLPIQSRYAIAFAHICSHFSFALHDFCPEEHEEIIERGLSHCNAVLDRLGIRIAEVVGRLTHDELVLAQKLSPQACAAFIAQAYQAAGNRISVGDTMPGMESHRTNRDVVTESDKNYIYLIDLCNAIGYSKTIETCEHTFAPREYLHTHLENEVISTLHKFFHEGNDKPPRRPSEMLMLLTAQISVIQNLETCLRFDLTSFLKNALLQQTQPHDSQGKDTLSSIYARWYLEVLLRKASTGQIVFSEHLQAFIGCSDVVPLNFAPERYTDTRELRALVQLIGPYGIKYLTERLVWHVACQINELLKLVRDHKQILVKARTSFDKPEQMRDLVSMLNIADASKERKQNKETSGASVGSPIESVLQRVTIIGEIIAFRNLLYDALRDVMEQKLPFLIGSLKGHLQSTDQSGEVQFSEMFAAAGFHTSVDVALKSAVQAQAQQSRMTDLKEHYELTCLLFVFIAISLPKLASSKLSCFKAGMKVSPNNCHVIPTAVNVMASALFEYHQQGDVQDRMREFLALASSSLLQIIGTPDADHMEMHQSVFILLEALVNGSPHLQYGLLESCFPFAMIRSSFLKCYNHVEDIK